MPAVVPAALRLLAALAVVAAVVGQWVRSVESPVYQFANFFGYFTIQSNLIAAVAFVVGAVLLLRRRDAPEWSVVLRGAAATYMVTTGIVYNMLLTNVALDNSFNVQWSNDVLHKWIPLFALLDWVLVGDRAHRLAAARGVPGLPAGLARRGAAARAVVRALPVPRRAAPRRGRGRGLVPRHRRRRSPG